VASFINQHTKTPEVSRNAKETLSKAKELQQGDFHLVRSINLLVSILEENFETLFLEHLKRRS
jgi:hypothetical protein